MAGTLTLVPAPKSDAADAVRVEVREFLAGELAAGSFVPHVDTWLGGVDAGFSRKVGERGWLGMTWPREYGGHERGALERYAVTEELLAAGAPVAAHWIADRQSGPSLLRYGTEEQRRMLLPRIAAGECFFVIGMSGEVTAAAVLTDAAVQAFDVGEQVVLAAAAAKIRAGAAVEVVARLAHQVHGAIGFTQEYRLHHLTRRLWAWRDEAGSERVWARELGASLPAGADLWPALTRMV